MPATIELLDPATTFDTGVTLAFHLETEPVTLEDAAAFFTFLHRSFVVVEDLWSELWREESAAHGLSNVVPEMVPVLEISSGSIRAVIRLVVKGAKAFPEAAKKFTIEVAGKVGTGLVAAMLLTSSPTPVDPVPQPPPPIVECADRMREPLDRLVRDLSKSGKPWRLELEDTPQSCRILVEGNQKPSARRR